MSFDTSAYLDLFREEAAECIQRLNQGLLHLEQHPTDADRLNDVFRAAHSLKGSARMMELEDVARVAHRLEDLLEGLRSGRLAVTSHLVDGALHAVDALATLVQAAGAEGTAPEVVGEVLDRLQHLEVPAASSPDHLSPAPASPTDPPRAAPTPSPAPARVAVAADRLDRILRLAAQLLTRNDARATRARSARGLVSNLVELEQAARTQAPSLYERVSRARQEAERFARSIADEEASSAPLVEDLYFESARARMVPVSSLFANVQRAARDAARLVGRPVDVVLHGDDTELDRRILDELQDPLLHLVRNAVDHGIELPRTRARAGKPERGEIRLAARPLGERVVIEVADDGAGLSPDDLRQAAVSKGLLTAEAAAALHDDEAVSLIFRPGFSTRASATELSGRGVGMDVVKTVVDRLEGQMRVSSRAGQGTRFEISLPLTIAATRVVLVCAAAGGRSQPFALPASAVEQCLWIEPEALRAGAASVTINGVGLPIRTLAALLDQPAPSHGPAVLLRDGDARLVLLVGTILGDTVVVVEPLGPLLRHVPSVTGGSILPSGQVALVLSVPHLVWGELPASATSP